MGTVIKEIKIKKIKLIIPQKTEPKKIKDRVSIILSLVILLKKNGFCKIWSIKHTKVRTMRPVINTLL